MYLTAVLTPKEDVLQTASATPSTSTVNSTTNTTEDFSDCLRDAQSDNSLTSIFHKASETYGVSMSLLTAMAKQESAFQANATSKSGAMGIMQLMPSTAEHFGCENPYDPEENIMTGAKYISELLDRYNGNVSYALAAYNAGYNNVDKYGGIPPFEETQNYVAKITAYMNEGVTLPDGTEITGSSKDSSVAASLLDKLDSDSFRDLFEEIFSREDYAGFLDLFLKKLSSAADTNTSPKADQTSARTEAGDSVKKTLDVSITSTPDSYYAYQNINYNNSVLNLMSQKTGSSD